MHVPDAPQTQWLDIHSVSNGTWKTAFNHPVNGSNATHTVRAWLSGTQGEDAVLRDVLFGDVFVCGGQSNMVFGLSMMINGTTEVENANRYVWEFRAVVSC